jgi:hypothetical protein
MSEMRADRNKERDKKIDKEAYRRDKDWKKKEKEVEIRIRTK